MIQPASIKTLLKPSPPGPFFLKCFDIVEEAVWKYKCVPSLLKQKVKYYKCSFPVNMFTLFDQFPMHFLIPLYGRVNIRETDYEDTFWLIHDKILLAY